MTASRAAAAAGRLTVPAMALLLACASHRRAGEPTDIYEAASEGMTSSVKAFIRVGADVNGYNAGGDTPLTASLGPHGSCETAKVLVGSGADVGRPTRGGDTPLMNAAMWLNADCVAFLLSSGANPNARAADGATALMLTGYAGADATIPVLTLLLDAGADPNLRATGGRTVLHGSPGSDDPRVRDLLRARGAKD